MQTEADDLALATERFKSFDKAKSRPLKDVMNEAQKRGRNSKKRGALFERKCKHELEAAGYSVVKAGASLGVADLWALKNGETFWVQCKSGKAVLCKQEWDELYQQATHFGAVPIYAMRKKEGRRMVTKWWVVGGDKVERRQLHKQPVEPWII